MTEIVGATGPLSRLKCAACGYVASSERLPDSCPMCGGDAWDHEPWRPFSDDPATSASEPYPRG